MTPGQGKAQLCLHTVTLIFCWFQVIQTSKALLEGSDGVYERIQQAQKAGEISGVSVSRNHHPEAAGSTESPNVDHMGHLH